MQCSNEREKGDESEWGRRARAAARLSTPSAPHPLRPLRPPSQDRSARALGRRRLGWAATQHRVVPAAPARRCGQVLTGQRPRTRPAPRWRPACPRRRQWRGPASGWAGGRSSWRGAGGQHEENKHTHAVIADSSRAMPDGVSPAPTERYRGFSSEKSELLCLAHETHGLMLMSLSARCLAPRTVTDHTRAAPTGSETCAGPCRAQPPAGSWPDVQ
jgi:hypothetical protein